MRGDHLRRPRRFSSQADRSFSVKRIVDQNVIVPVDRPIVIEIAIAPAREPGIEPVIDQRVVAAVHNAVKIGIAEISVLHQNIRARDGLAVKVTDERPSAAVVIELDSKRRVAGAGRRCGDNPARSRPIIGKPLLELPGDVCQFRGGGS